MSTGDDNTEHNEPADRDNHQPSGMRTWCRDCDGKGLRVIPRMAVLSGGRDLSQALAGGEFVTGFETRPCPTCEASGWLPGMVPPV